MKNNKQFKNLMRPALALFLAICMLCIGPLNDLSEGGARAARVTLGQDKSDITYDGDSDEQSDESQQTTGEASIFLKEIRYFHGDEGKEQAEKEGWYVHDTNLNEGNEGDSLWLAYKTTENRDEAITSIKTMEMKGGYETTNYRKLMESVASGLSDMADSMITAASEFRQNLDKGYRSAEVSKEFLNLYTLQDGGIRTGGASDSSKLLGNYLLSGNYKIEDIRDLLMQTNTGVLSVILSRLASGAFSPEDKFTDKLPGMVTKMNKISNQAALALDTKYKSVVLDLKNQLQAFSKEVRDAQARAQAAGNQVVLSDGTPVPVDTDASGKTGGDIKDVSLNEVKEQTEKQITSMNKVQGEKDIVTLSTLNALNRYSYDGSLKLGDKIVELGQLQFTKLSEVRRVYPLVMAMTPGQSALLEIGGFTLITESLLDNEQVYANLEQKIDELKNMLSEQGFSAAPVWDQENRELFSGDICYTKKAIRANAAGANFTDVTKTTTAGRIWNEFQSVSGVISAVSGAIFAIAGFVTGIALPTTMVAVGAEIFTAAWAAGATAACIESAAVIGLGVLGCIGLAILIISGLVWLGKKIYNYFKEWDEYDYDEEDIPRLMLDADETEDGTMANIMYYLTTDPDNDRADLTCSKGKRWNALYYTRNQVAGDPICAASEKDIFHSVLGELKETPKGFEAVGSFSVPNAQSINSYAKDKDSGNHYLYYRTSLDGEFGKIEKQKIDKSKGKYIADIRIFNGATETEAKTALAREGYKLFDTNVSPKGDAGRQYSYIGYKTTNKANAAVRDIRVCLSYPGSGLKIGDIPYSAGQGEDEHTESNAFICHTTSSEFASPIRAENVFFVTKRSDAEPGWEPVNLICGGPAFNWHDINEKTEFIDESYHKTRDYFREKGLFMYFKPDETYTSGEEYLSGILFVAGTSNTKDAGSILQDYMDELGVKPYERIAHDVGATLDSADTTTRKTYSSDATQTNRAAGVYQEYDIWMTYTTTHNPYRAITDVKYYSSDHAKYGLAPQLSIAGVGYGACETYEQIYNRMSYEMNRFYTSTHAFLGPDVDGQKYRGYDGKELIAKLRRYDPDNSKGRLIDYRGMYTAGYRKETEPLKPSDIVVKKSAEDVKGFGPIEEFLNKYDANDKNIGFKDIKGNDNSAYVYVRGLSKPVRPKYVKNIVGTHFETPKEVDNNGETVKLNGEQMKMYDDLAIEQCRMQALQQGAEEIVMQNLTGNISKKEEGDGVAEYYSYVGVIRTDKEPEAMRGVLKYWLGGWDIEKKGPSAVKVGGVKYQLSGVTIRSGSNYVFSLYTSSQTGAGAPITEIAIDKEPFKADYDTMLGASTEDKGKGVNQVFANTDLGSDEISFLHMKRSESEKTYYSRLAVSFGTTMKNAMCAALSKGCNRCIPLNLNKDAGVGEKKAAKYVVLGARTCGVTSKDIAIRDIVCTVGEESKESFTKDGFEYIRAGNVSLNRHSEYGKQIYVYYTHGVKFGDGSEGQTIGEATDDENTPTSTEDDLGDWLDDNDEDETTIIYMDKAPITRLAATERDFLPESIPGIVWEKILDTKGNRVNTNEGAYYRNENGDLVDNRIYLYDAHEDGGVKPGAKITETDGKYTQLVGFLKLIGK